LTRKEKEQCIQKEDGKVFEIFNVEIDVAYLNAYYAVSKQSTNEISSTGRLGVFEIASSKGGPSFLARWDGGSRGEGKKEKYDLDIDIEGVPAEERIRFKNGRGGYSGHHTTKVASDAGHAYQVFLRTPAERIFEGSVRFSLHRKLRFEESIALTETFGHTNQ
jgi:hypothetical protein